MRSRRFSIARLEWASRVRLALLRARHTSTRLLTISAIVLNFEILLGDESGDDEDNLVIFEDQETKRNGWPADIAKSFGAQNNLTMGH